MRHLASIAVRPWILKLMLWTTILNDFDNLARTPIPVRSVQQ